MRSKFTGRTPHEGVLVYTVACFGVVSPARHDVRSCLPSRSSKPPTSGELTTVRKMAERQKLNRHGLHLPFNDS